MNLKPYLLRFWNFWPPFFFSGIKITKKTKNFRHYIVTLKLRFWNANYVGTQYGGSIFSMTDPFYMLMLIHNLGPEYVVWDKAAHIRYLRPGKTNLTAEFFLSEEDIQKIRETIEKNEKMEWVRKIEIRDKSGEVVAEVNKTISIKRKKQTPQKNIHTL